MLSKNRYIWEPLTKFWSDAPVGSGTPAHVAHVPARLQATSAEVPEPVGVTDQKSKMGVSMYPLEVSFLQIYKKFRDLVASPSNHLIYLSENRISNFAIKLVSITFKSTCEKNFADLVQHSYLYEKTTHKNIFQLRFHNDWRSKKVVCMSITFSKGHTKKKGKICHLWNRYYIFVKCKISTSYVFHDLEV